LFQPQPISRESIPRALTRAERYRLLNEPFQAESICRDILAADPGNQEAAIGLLLALTDMFDAGEAKLNDVRPIARSLSGAYEKLYYEGLAEERWACSLITQNYPPASIYDHFLLAMQRFEAAKKLAPSGNDDAVLRWNCCVRLIKRHGLVAEPDSETGDSCSLDDHDVPMR